MRHILVGLDLGARRTALTPGSRRAIDQALWLAGLTQGRVTLLHSTAADERWEESDGDYVAVPAGLLLEGRRCLEGAADAFRREKLEVELVLSEEKAWLAIVRRVLNDGIDLVIAGKRSDAQPPEHRIGSVSMKLLRKCPCPVWVVKPRGAARPRRVLAATDLSEVGERVVRHAAWVAARCGAELHVVHAFQMPLSVQLEGAASEVGYEHEQREQAIRSLRAQVAEVSDPDAAVFHVALTAPTRAIVRCVDRIDPDLVVMGTLSRGGVAGLIVGNTAERLLDRLDCSLLAVKPRDFVCPVAANAPPPGPAVAGSRS